MKVQKLDRRGAAEQKGRTEGRIATQRPEDKVEQRRQGRGRRGPDVFKAAGGNERGGGSERLRSGGATLRKPPRPVSSRLPCRFLMFLKE